MTGAMTAARPPTVSVFDNGALKKALESLGPGTVLQEVKTTVVQEVVAERPVEKVKEQRHPLQVQILIDESGSMAGHKWQEALAGVNTIADQLTRGQDQVSLATFNDRLNEKVAMGYFDTNADALKASVDEMKGRSPGGRTALYDSVLATVRKFSKITRRRGKPEYHYWLFVLTDGDDVCSTATQEEVRRAIQECQTELGHLHVTLLAVLDDFPKGHKLTQEENESRLSPMQVMVDCPSIGNVLLVENAPNAVKEQITTTVRTVMEKVSFTIRNEETTTGVATGGHAEPCKPNKAEHKKR